MAENARQRGADGRFLPGMGGVALASPATIVQSLPRSQVARAKAKRAAISWTKRREDRFLTALADWPNVAAAQRASGLSEGQVYRMRRNADDFRAKWAVALRESYLKLETALLERALNGIEKPIFHGGKQIGTVIEYNDRAALALLAMHRAAVKGMPAEAGEVPALSIEERRARLQARLSEMNRRMGGAG